MIAFTFVKEAPAGATATVSGVLSDRLESHPDQAFLESVGFTGKLGQTATMRSGDGVSVLVGLGPSDRLDVAAVRAAAGGAAKALVRQETVATSLVADALAGGLPAESAADAAQALAEGTTLGAYSYTALKSDPKPSKLTAVSVVGGGGKRLQGALDRGAAVGRAQCIVRDLVNEPGGTLTPMAFADRARELGQELGFEVEVLDEDGIREAGMGGLLGVSRGSHQPPRFVELRWTPPGKRRGVVALVGKGVTFDSGGLSLKTSDGMTWMKGDMGGGGAVLGAFCALAAAPPKVEVRGYVPLTDNMPGPDAMRVGDVLRISDGQTVEVLNTDAEGRLILADALVRAAAGTPDAIIDLATLTGACMVALGARTAGAMSNHQGLLDQVLAAAGAAGELMWPLVLPEHLEAELDSEIADCKNIGGRYGGAQLAGIFLRRFVPEGVPWVHLDIAGPAWAEAEEPTTRKGATGYGVRTLVSFLSSFTRPGASPLPGSSTR